MKLIHVTDTHFAKPGETIFGLDPRARLEACVADINVHHADADLCVITGDLTHWGEPEAYASLKAVLGALKVPLKLLLGNHDNREAFLAAFPEAVVDNEGFVQDAFDTPAGRFLLLDSNHPGTHAGVYCESRLAWLDSQLTAPGDVPVFLFVHHPPFPVHLAPVDAIGLLDAAAFERVVARHSHKIRHLFYGHVHRPICGSWHGIACSTIRATAHQVWLDFSASDAIPGSHEPPAYAVAFIDATSVVIHGHDYLDASSKFELGPTSFEAWQRKAAVGA
ncbi:MAG: phosphodiesterase [Kiloniellales bacterium]|nr:phosphodiesterase [Kiloniellales bacterium]